MRDLIIWLFILFVSQAHLCAQPAGGLNIGEKVPEIVLKHIFQNQTRQISLQQFRGKLIIIDFWNTWCGTCIEAFPKMEKLQRQFGDLIQILLVTTDTEKQVNKLFLRVQRPNLPIITDDKYLNNLFPHNSVPHHIWINKEGLVQFITDGYNAVPENVNKLLKGENLTLHFKNEAIDFNPDTSLLEEGKGRLHKYVIGYSIALRKIEDYGGSQISFIKDTGHGYLGFKLLNIPLLDAYKMAWGESIYTGGGKYQKNNRVVFLTRDSDNFSYPSQVNKIQEWELRNIISYESKWSLIDESTAYLYFQKDMNCLFRYKVDVEERNSQYYEIVNITTRLKALSKGGYPKFIYNDTIYSMRNMSINNLVRSLNDLKWFDKIPVINSGLDFKIDLTLNNAFISFARLEEELSRNGLQLQKRKGKLKMLVIQDKY